MVGLSAIQVMGDQQPGRLSVELMRRQSSLAAAMLFKFGNVNAKGN
jgi:hypothetical protein